MAALLAWGILCPALRADGASPAVPAPSGTAPFPLKVTFSIASAPGACTETPAHEPNLIHICFAGVTVGDAVEMYAQEGGFGVLLDNDLAEKSLPCNLRLDCLTPESGLAKVVQLGGGFLTRLDENTWVACRILMDTPPPVD